MNKQYWLPFIFTYLMAANLTIANAQTNCQKTLNQSEKAICSDKILWVQNKSLDGVYGLVQGWLKEHNPDLAGQISTSESSWINQRNDSCKASAKCLSESIYLRSRDIYEYGLKYGFIYNVHPELKPQEIYKNSLQYIAQIEFEKDVEQKPGQFIKIRSSGTAVKIWPKHFVTNNHILEGSSKFISFDYLGKLYNAQVVNRSAALDLAIIAVPDAPEDHLHIANLYTTTPGDTVYAIGNPSGLFGSISQGIISAIRTDPIKGNHISIQNTAPISPGSSGGALLNTRGEVIGVTTYFLGDKNQLLNFSVPIEQVDTLLE